jgi:NitT/TauT family transport system substrate-binding protein
MAGGNDGAFTSTAYTVPLVAARRPARPVLFADFDLNLPGFGLFTTASVLQKKGDALKSLASITAGAWAYILNGHEEEAVQAMMKAREQDRLDAGVLGGQLKASLPFLYTEATAKLPIGVQSAEDWAGAIALMEKAKVIEPGSQPADYFTNDYLDLDLIKSIATGG